MSSSSDDNRGATPAINRRLTYAEGLRKYLGASEEYKKRYCVFKCVIRSDEYMSNSKQKNERRGCGELSITYTAKYTGNLPKGVSWQPPCNHCKKKTRLGGITQHLASFETKLEAKQYIKNIEIQKQKDAWIVEIARCKINHERLDLILGLQMFCLNNDLEFDRSVFQ